VGKKREIDTVISHLAVRQWGHVTRAQLRAAGLAPSSIDGRVRTGSLIAVHAGVYAVGYRRVEPVARARAAVLAGGPTAVLSHDSALALWNLRRWPPEPEITVTTDRRRPGIVVHRSRTLTRADRTVELGVPTTRVARALHDLRTRITDRQLTRLTNDARLRKLISAEDALRLLGHDRNPTRSGLEDDFQRWLKRHSLPQPWVNVIINGREVDAYFPDQDLIVELDAWATHNDPATFQSDRDRDFDHWETNRKAIRLTRERFTDDIAARLRRKLDLMSRAAPPRAPDPPAY
jgi:hypothetical protein